MLRMAYVALSPAISCQVFCTFQSTGTLTTSELESRLQYRRIVFESSEFGVVK